MSHPPCRFVCVSARAGCISNANDSAVQANILFNIRISIQYINSLNHAGIPATHAIVPKQPAP